MKTYTISMMTGKISGALSIVINDLLDCAEFLVEYTDESGWKHSRKFHKPSKAQKALDAIGKGEEVAA